jgi:acetyltransferase-like isoleucine patch superfamily enzyme
MNLIRSLRFQYYRFLGWLTVVSAGTTRSGPVHAIGAPVIDVFPGSEIGIGTNVTLISASFATALGVNHPVVLRTMAADARISIGERVGISGGSICAAALVEIGDDTMLGANVTVADTDFHSLLPANRRHDGRVRVKEVIIGKRVFIGANSIILKGVCIGDGSVIGAGSVVTRSIPANSIAAGNPCRVIREFTTDELLS